MNFQFLLRQKRTALNKKRAKWSTNCNGVGRDSILLYESGCRETITRGGSNLRDCTRTSSLTETPNMYIFLESSNRALDRKYHFCYLPITQLRAPGARSCCLTFFAPAQKGDSEFSESCSSEHTRGKHGIVIPTIKSAVSSFS